MPTNTFSCRCLRWVLRFGAALVVAAAGHAQITFQFTYIGTEGVGFNDGTTGTTRKSALEAAAGSLASYFVTAAPVTLTYTVNSYTTNDSTLASAGSNLLSSGDGFFRTVVQEKIIGGTDANGATADGEINWNWSHAWDLTDTVSANAQDLKSTVMHELLHSFGFLSYIESNSATAASKTWAIFDKFVTTSAGTSSLVVNPTTYVFQGGAPILTGGGTSTTFATAGLYFSGPNALAANGGNPVPVYSPAPWEDGSSGSHLADNFYDGTNAAMKMMNSASTNGPGVRTLSAIELGILTDLGYGLVATQSAPVPAVAGVALGGSTQLTFTPTGTGPFTYQWRRNGVNIAGATNATLTLGNVQPTDAGLYTMAVTNAGGTTVTSGTIVAPTIATKVVGTGTEVGADISHPNGNIYDQILLTGTAASITADPGQIVRTSYIDLTDDIVQVEFAGAGTLTITLESATGPALPVNYNQSVQYMRGHATLTIVGADQSTNVSAFTVGTNTAVNQALFKQGTNYDGVADLARVNVASTNGQFGGLRFANGGFFAASGLTGINAPGVNVVAVTWVHNVTANDQATPVLLTGTIGNGRIGVTGGDMFQPNGRTVQVGTAQSITMQAGENSHKVAQPAKQNRGVFTRNGVVVTNTLVVNP